MKIISIIFTAFVLVFTGAQTASADPSADQKATIHVLQTYSAAINKGDMDAMGHSVMAEGNDFTIFEGAGSDTGWANYRDHHLAPEFANPDLKFHKFEFNDIKSTIIGDWAFATFSIEKSYTYKGKDTDKTGRGTAILKRVGNVWKIKHLHTS